jgi:hypothetical protein
MGARTRNFWLVVWENIVLGYSRVNQIEGLILEWRGVERLKMEGRVFLEELEKSVVEDTIRSDSAPFLYMWERQPRAGRGDQKGCRSSAESSVRSVKHPRRFSQAQRVDQKTNTLYSVFHMPGPVLLGTRGLKNVIAGKPPVPIQVLAEMIRFPP